LKTVHRIIKGCGNLPDMGDHPGTGFLFIFILMGGIAGVDRGGWKGFVGGCVFIAVFMVPIYLIGAHDRAVEQERMNDRRD